MSNIYKNLKYLYIPKFFKLRKDLETIIKKKIYIYEFIIHIFTTNL
jgi:hypothetical protein